MKTVRKLLLAILTSVLFFCMASTCMAATAATYKNYVKKQMVPSLGKAAKGTAKSQPVNHNFEGWCKSRGVLSVYASNLDGKKGKEALVVYLKNSPMNDSNRNDRTKLCLAVLSQKNGKIVVNQHMSLGSDIDYGLFADIRVYLKNYKNKKYVVVQKFTGIDGCACETYVLAMNSAGKLAVKKALFDPGYTVGVGLYRLPVSGVVDDIITHSYSNSGAIYSSDWGEATDSIYGTRLQKELSNFGIKISMSKTFFNTKAWMVQKNTNMVTICAMKASSKYSQNGYVTTYSISDRTNF